MGRVRGEVRLAVKPPTVIHYYCHTPPQGLRWQDDSTMKLFRESFSQGQYTNTKASPYTQ